MGRIIPFLCFHTMAVWLDRLRHGGSAWSWLLGEAGRYAYWDDAWCVFCRRIANMERRTGLGFDPLFMSALQCGTAGETG